MNEPHVGGAQKTPPRLGWADPDLSRPQAALLGAPRP